MSSEDLNYWGDLGIDNKLDPLTELHQQARALESASGGSLKGIVRTSEHDRPSLYPKPPTGIQAIAAVAAAYHQTASEVMRQSGPLDEVIAVNRALKDVVGLEAKFYKHSFEIEAPKLGYVAKLFEIEHLLECLPVVFKSDLLDDYKVVSTADGFHQVLASWIGCQRIRLLARTLAQSSISPSPPGLLAAPEPAENNQPRPDGSADDLTT